MLSPIKSWLGALLALVVGCCPAVRAQGYNAAQQLALNSIPLALTNAVTASRAALTAASLATPPNEFELAAKAGALFEDELALALYRADLLARLQASPNRLSAAQLAQAAQQAAGGRGGRGGAAPAGGVAFADAPKVLLWPAGAPGALGDAEADKPFLAVYLAPRREGAPPAPAVVIAPGGGYFMVSAAGSEGTGTAQWLNSLGISAFVLRYRVSPYRQPAELDDGRRAMRLVRARAAEFGVDPKRIGMMGFSAGGHLAAYTSSVIDGGRSDDADPLERVSSRPDFAILVYPVISFNPAIAGPQNLAAYAGSGRNLLGENADPALVFRMSAETQVTAANPPTFLYHGSADTLVTPENSLRFYLALRQAGVPAELHTYENGTHGTGLGVDDPIRGTVGEVLKTWLRVRGLVSFEIP